jgi:hypothetical protein
MLRPGIGVMEVARAKSPVANVEIARENAEIFRARVDVFRIAHAGAELAKKHGNATLAIEREQLDVSAANRQFLQPLGSAASAKRKPAGFVSVVFASLSDFTRSKTLLRNS